MSRLAAYEGDRMKLGFRRVSRAVECSQQERWAGRSEHLFADTL